MSKFIFVLVLSLLSSVAFCKNLKQAKVMPIIFSSNFSKTYTQVLICINEEFDGYLGDGRMRATVYPDFTQYSIGAMQFDSFSHHYLINLTHSSISIQAQGDTFFPMNTAEVIDKVKSCI